MQTGLTLTFLQHGKVRKLSKQDETITYMFDEHPLSVSMKSCESYKHQEGWKDFIDNKGCLTDKPVEVIGPVNPGAVVRHAAYSGQTKIEESPAQVLSLYFAQVGCLALPINRGSGVLVIPEVDNIVNFTIMRPYMTPQSSRDCRITSAGDAALQAQIRVLSKRIIDIHHLPSCYAITFQATPWASQQKSRVQTLHVLSGEEIHLRQFEIALAELPPRVISRTIKRTSGRGKNKQETERTEWFWVDSIVRPLVADNLAQGKRWYEGFTELMTKIDPVSKTSQRSHLL